MPPGASTIDAHRAPAAPDSRAGPSSNARGRLSQTRCTFLCPGGGSARPSGVKSSSACSERLAGRSRCVLAADPEVVGHFECPRDGLTALPGSRLTGSPLPVTCRRRKRLMLRSRPLSQRRASSREDYRIKVSLAVPPVGSVCIDWRCAVPLPTRQIGDPYSAYLPGPVRPTSHPLPGRCSSPPHLQKISLLGTVSSRN